MTIIILWLIIFIIGLPILVIFIECMASLFPLSYQVDTDNANLTYNVLIPAHNEATVIANTLKSLLPQVIKPEQIVLVADNCTDATGEIARQFGVTVLERENLEQRGKGYALDHGMNYLSNNPPDVVILVDADSIVAPQTIHELVTMVSHQNKPIQALSSLETPAQPGTNDFISALAYLVKNQVRPTGLKNLGLPCLLNGTGMAFPWAILKDAPLATGNIVEDMQLGLDLSLAGNAPVFCPTAKVTGILPQQLANATSQRTRWEHGHLQTLLTQAPRLFKGAIAQGRIDLLALALELAVPPLSLLVMLWIVGMIITGIVGIWQGYWPPVMTLAIAGVLMFIAIISAWAKFGRQTIPGRALIAIPFYLLWKIPLYFSFIIKRQAQWIRTERDNA